MGSCISSNHRILNDKQIAGIGLKHHEKKVAIYKMYKEKAKQAPILKLHINPLYVKRISNDVSSKIGTSISTTHIEED
ncbi:unnamed protein product [Blepharisma stoltei]|uniref:Uncharacterized protein n=1 Tax=Blepharisma stoltei TaxID=1481888 RepID=A0AAU9IX73_9CILI|nr:unnamed protein product [Blepharisma stoltei]